MADTEKLAQMMIRCGLATGHGDTIDDLLFELEKQIKNTSNAFSDARKKIERLRKLLRWWHYSSNVDVTMQGPIFKGVSGSRREVWQATLDEFELEEKEKEKE